MNDQTPVTDALDATSPAICFSLAKRAAAGVPGRGPSDALDAAGAERGDAGQAADLDMRIERLAERFDQLEFVIIEQFEPGMIHAGGVPAGSLRDRLDRIEAAVEHLSHDPVRPTDRDDSEGERRLDALAVRLDGLERAIADAASGTETRHAALVAAVERIATRPAPAPDLTAQHRSFAGFAAALQTTLGRQEAAAQEIVLALGTFAARLEAVEARLDAKGEQPPPAEPSAASPSAGLETSLGLLGDRIGALARAIGAGPPAATPPEIASIAGRLDHLALLLAGALEEDARGRRASIEETLRDMRMTVAEIVAENRRLHVA